MLRSEKCGERHCPAQVHNRARLETNPAKEITTLKRTLLKASTCQALVIVIRVQLCLTRVSTACSILWAGCSLDGIFQIYLASPEITHCPKKFINLKYHLDGERHGPTQNGLRQNPAIDHRGRDQTMICFDHKRDVGFDLQELVMPATQESKFILQVSCPISTR